MKDIDKVRTIFALEVEKLYNKAMGDEKPLSNEDLRKLEILASINKTLDNKLMDSKELKETKNWSVKDLKDLVDLAPKPQNNDQQ